MKKLLFLAVSALMVPIAASGQLINGGFEDGLAHWTASPNAELSIESVIVSSGSQSLKIVGAADGEYAYAGQLVAIDDTYRYSLSGQVYNSDASAAMIKVYWFASADGTGTSTYVSTGAAGTGNWESLEIVNLTPPPGTRSARVRARLNYQTLIGERTAYFDALGFIVSYAPPLIGHTPPSLRSLWQRDINIDFEVTAMIDLLYVRVYCRSPGETADPAPNGLLLPVQNGAYETYDFSAALTRVEGDAGIEYRIEAWDGVTYARWPASGYHLLSLNSSAPAQRFLTETNPLAVFGSEALEVRVTDLRGNEVFNELNTGGIIVWNAAPNGNLRETGIYIYRVKTDKGEEYGTIVIAR